DQKEDQKYLDFWIDAEVRFQNVFTNISNHGIEAFNKLGEALKAEGITTKGIADWLNSETDKTFATLRATVAEIKAIKAWFESLPENAKAATGIGKSDIEDPTGGAGNLGIKKPSIQFFNPFKGTGTHPDITDFGGRRRDEGVD